ncbi:hypothetical protein GCM10007916_02530 [Psychromonas marina]|uniref:Porin n=1 Tax=Psychromonas marina TaxID=88364 RepID=A0ABQ6DVN9_9GAMM|nr:hypothetical protein [Psychromonas marina]GLS89186.1 hypothetical protein GCM10007916_02530 [Psychromonas marina]
MKNGLIFKNHSHKTLLGCTLLLSLPSFAEDQPLQDMSDPLAVYSQAGVGYTDKGINIKFGQAYDTGEDTTMGMNIIEIKGIAGEEFGWNGEARASNDNSIDSIRFRNFGVDLTNGRGTQLDVEIAFTDNNGAQGSASYSFMQALPKMGPVNIYPLAGVGVAFGETFDGQRQGDAQMSERWDLHGTFYVAGLYSKIEVTDKIWLNYNPMYLGTISGADNYKQYGMQGDDTVFLHEASVSYQFNTRSNIRYYANWSENERYRNGDHRIEVNYQF